MLPKSKEIYSSEVIKGFSGFIFLSQINKNSLVQCLGACRCTRTMDATESTKKIPQCHRIYQKELSTSEVNPEHGVKKHTQEIKKILAATHWITKSARG